MGSPTNPINRRRSERVMLQMKVTVTAEDVERKPRKEEALTLVVNAHGGLLKMKLHVHVGQPMRLANPQNNVTSSTFGVITAVANNNGAAFYPERQLRLGVRYSF